MTSLLICVANLLSSELFPRFHMFKSLLTPSISIGKIGEYVYSWVTVRLRVLHSCPDEIAVRSPQIYLLLKSEKSILDNVGDIMVSNIYGRTHRYTLFCNAHTIQD